MLAEGWDSCTMAQQMRNAGLPKGAQLPIEKDPGRKAICKQKQLSKESCFFSHTATADKDLCSGNVPAATSIPSKSGSLVTHASEKVVKYYQSPHLQATALAYFAGDCALSSGYCLHFQSSSSDSVNL
jgi:hypothetical protein